MPATRTRNLLYRLLLPAAASPRHRMRLETPEGPLSRSAAWLRLQRRHHVMGSSLLLRRGEEVRSAHTSLTGGQEKAASAGTLYRVASITKMATALVVLRLWEQGRLSLDAPLAGILPGVSGTAAAQVTVRQLLSHTAGLADTPRYLQGLQRGEPASFVLQDASVRIAAPGSAFHYCNFGFGLLGCVIEQVTGLSVTDAFDRLLIRPLSLDASLDASRLDPGQIMGIQRILDRRQTLVRVTPLGKIPLEGPDPMRHYGHTAGALYATATDIDRLLQLIGGGGEWHGRRLLHAETVAEMCRPHASYGPSAPGLRYGLGLLIIDLPALSGTQLLGHQGFAYGCVDGAFLERGTGRQVVLLDGGASELRIHGRLGAVVADTLRWALKEEMPSWPS